MTTDNTKYAEQLAAARRGERIERLYRPMANRTVYTQYLCPCGRWVYESAETVHKNHCKAWRLNDY